MRKILCGFKDKPMKSKILSKSEKPFESFGQPSYFNSVLIPKLFNRVTSSSSELMEGGKQELPLSPIYNLNVTDEEED